MTVAKTIENTWFALCSNGMLEHVVGFYDNYDDAESGADSLGLDVIWLVCGDDASQWADTITAKHIAA